MIYLVPCGICGQIWQRATAQGAHVITCIFCGCPGHLRLGVAWLDGGARGHCRIEAWLHAAGAEER
jgi:hypothetical protein